MKRILLVVPRYSLSNKANYTYLFSLGLSYISAVLKKEGYPLDIINLNHLNGRTEDLINEVLDKREYGFVLTGNIGIGYAITEKILNTAKKHPSNPKTVLGGAILTSESKVIFEALKPDYGVLGEGEITIIELLKAIDRNKDLKKIKGIVYKENNKTIFTQKRELIEDINTLPFPDLEGLGFEEKIKMSSFSDHPFGTLDYPRNYPILCSRGCPFQCTFCYHSLGMKYRIRSIDNIIEELEKALEKYKINSITIYDDLFSVDKERLFEFCRRIKELIKKYPWECQWNCQLTVHNIDKEMIDVLRDAGCVGVSFGFESYNRSVLKSMKKPITPEQIDNAIKLVKGSGIGIQGCFIFGDSAETKGSAKETLDYWKKHCDGQVQIGFIQPYPGSEIYKRCIEKGIIKDKLEFIKNHMLHANWINMTDNMSNKEILELKKEIIKSRVKYSNYVIPSKVKSIGNKRYMIKVKCPFCKKNITYTNGRLYKNRIFYEIMANCKNCKMRFIISSHIHKFITIYYNELDFLRKNFLKIMDKIKKRNL